MRNCSTLGLHSSRATAFTLVELMAVVGIIALLAVVGIPAMKGLTGSGGRKQALTQVLGALEVARNLAISTGTNAAVLFPDQTFTENEAYKYRSLAVVSYKDSTLATNTNPALPFDKFVTGWIVLPQGISFFPDSLQTNTSSNLVSRSAIIRIPPKTQDVEVQCPAIVFQADGGLLDGPVISTAGIAYFEGTVEGEKSKFTSTMTNLLETVRIARYTGRAYATLATNSVKP